MRRLLPFALAAVLAGCTSASYTETAEEVRLHVGLGGFVAPILARYDRWEAEGKRIVIDGQMISADAFGAFSARNACYTERAVFSPHAASELGLIPNYAATDRLAARLPEPLEAWFRASPAYRDWVGFAVVSYPELLEIWPEGACDPDREAALRRWQAREAAAARANPERVDR